MGRRAGACPAHMTNGPWAAMGSSIGSPPRMSSWVSGACMRTRPCMVCAPIYTRTASLLSTDH
eukprot:scaffold67852_cov60-Phaeocystis_antarctica.AAC.3